MACMSPLLRCVPLWILAAAGCVGGAPGDPPGGGNPDAPRVPVDGPRAADAMLVDASTEFLCRDRITSGLDSGRHNPGQNCIQACHNHGFALAGTLYSSAAGGQTVSGASITFIDAAGNTGDMRTGLNGNFWWTLPVVFPVKIIASMCPDVKPMVATVNAAGAGCNQAGCHAATGGAGRIHLP